MFLSLVLALSRLAKAASSKAQESKETVITPRHITAVASVSVLNVSARNNELSFILLHIGRIGKPERLKLFHYSLVHVVLSLHSNIYTE